MDEQKIPLRRTWLGKEPIDGLAGHAAPFVFGLLLLVAAYIATRFFDVNGLITGPAGALLFIAAVRSVSGRRYDTTIVQPFMIANGLLVFLWLLWTGLPWAWKSPTLVSITLGCWLLVVIVDCVLWAGLRDTQWRLENRRNFEHMRGKPVDEQPAAPKLSPEAQRWLSFFEAHNAKGIEFINREPSLEGPVINLRLPADGSLTFARVEALTAAVEIMFSDEDDKIIPGSVRIIRKRVRNADGETTRESVRDIQIRIDAARILSHKIMIPDEHHKLDIEDAFPIGRYRDGTLCKLTVRELHWVISGSSGGGKSNLVHVLIHTITRCRNATIWAIDRKGGETFKPWLRPWLQKAIDPITGELCQPIIKWLAVDVHEAHRMWLAAMDLAQDRYNTRKAGNKTRPTPAQPHIVFFVEEAGQILGQDQQREAALWERIDFRGFETTSVQTFRSAAISLGKILQRNSVTSGGSGDADENYNVRIAGKTPSAQSAGMTATTRAGRVNAASLVDNGAFVVTDLSTGHRPGEEVKTYFAGDDEEFDRIIWKAATLHNSLAGDIPEGSREDRLLAKYGFGTQYKDPKRIGWVTGEHIGAWPGLPFNPNQTSSGATVEDKKPSIVQRYESYQRANGLLVDEPAPEPAEQRPAYAAVTSAAEFKVRAAEFRARRAAEAEGQPVVGRQAAGDAQPAGGRRLSANQQACYDVVLAFGPGGGTYGDVADELEERKVIKPSGRSQVDRWLKALQDCDLVVKHGNQATSRYYAAQVLAAAA